MILHYIVEIFKNYLLLAFDKFYEQGFNLVKKKYLKDK